MTTDRSRRFRVQRGSFGHRDLQGHEVDTGHGLRHRVLDLEAGVHLEEVRLARVEVGIADEELDRPGPDVADRLRGGQGGRVQRRPHLVADARRWRLFDDLLVATLDGAVAIAQHPDRAVGVGEDLDLDVASRRQIGLDEHRTVTERRSCFGRRGSELASQLPSLGHDPHSASATTGRCLDQQREVGVHQRVDVHREDRHARGGHDLLRPRLRAHRVDGIGRGPNPDQPCRLNRTREFPTLREESIARVDRVRPRGQRRRDHEITAKVGVSGSAARHTHCGVGLADERCAGIGVRVHGNGPDPQGSTGRKDPSGDLATVGHEQGADHRLVAHVSHIRKTPKPPLAPSTGVLWIADRHMPSTDRVSRGSITPSS